MPAGRLKVLGFGTAFVLAQLLTCSLLVIIGVAATGSSRKSHSGLQAALELVLAAVLVRVAIHIRRRPATARSSSKPRPHAVIERLAGLLLGIGGPKRLVVTALAATTITTAGLSDSGEAALVILYCAIATIFVWVPVIVFLLFGDQAIGRMKSAQENAARRQPHVTVYALLVLAAFLAIDAVGVLLAQSCTRIKGSCGTSGLSSPPGSPR